MDLVLSARTVRQQVGGVKVLDTPPWRMEGIDFAADLGIKSSEGATEMTARAFDKQGDLATFNLHGNSIPYAEWLRGKLPTLSSLSGCRSRCL